MINKIDIEQAILKYPYPNYVYWYVNKFPTRQYIFIGCVFVALGFILTIVKAERVYIAVPTFITCGMLLIAAVLHYSAGILKRMVEKKRAKYLGITLRQYWEYYNLNWNES